MKHKVIALTGGIGSGKSEVARILQKRGFTVLFCDKIAAEVATEKSVLDRIETLLGEECVANGILNRKAVREKVFADNELYKAYSDIFWDSTKSRLSEQVEAAYCENSACKNRDVVFVEIPIISAFDYDWWAVWLVESDKNIRVKRVRERDAVSEQNVSQIMSRQAEVQFYTVKIENNGGLAELENSVDSALLAQGLI